MNLVKRTLAACCAWKRLSSPLWSALAYFSSGRGVQPGRVMVSVAEHGLPQLHSAYYALSGSSATFRAQ